MARHSLLIPVYVPTFLLAFAQGMLVPTLPLYAQSFGVSFSLVSLAVAAAGIGTLAADVPAGMLLERFGRRPIMLVGTVGLALCTLSVALVPVFPALVALRLLAGVGTAMWNISRLAYLTDATSVAERGRALSTFGGVSRIGTFGGPAVGGVLATAFGLGTPFIAAAGIESAAALLALVFIQETRTLGNLPQRRAGHMRWRLVGGLVRRHARDLSTAGLAQIFAQMIRAGRQIIIPLYGTSVLGLPVAAVGTIISVSAAIDMSLFLPAGVIMDRLGRKYASVPSFLVLGLGMGLVPLAADFTGLLIATSVMGVGNGLGSGSMMTLGADLAPREATGEFLGVWRLIGDLGGTGGPLVVGGIADALGLAYAAIVLAGAGVVAAATLAAFVQETLQPKVARAAG